MKKNEEDHLKAESMNDFWKFETDIYKKIYTKTFPITIYYHLNNQRENIMLAKPLLKCEIHFGIYLVRLAI